MKKSGSIKLQEHVKQTRMLPNYMKSTTSSDARKEVSTKTRCPPDDSNLRRKSSNNKKLTLASANSVRKVVLCQNIGDSQRSTCSSALKDRKFPAYLSLNPGGTELEGTSIVKVCPYHYCSLNGHRHAPLPPLECFLLARRRMIKAQMSIRQGCLSPSRVKSVLGDGPKFKEKIGMKTYLESSRISNLTEEKHGDLFVEIFSNKNEAQEAQVRETGLEESFCYEVDANEIVDQEVNLTSMDVEADEQYPSPFSVQEETKQGILSELQVEGMENVPFYDLISESSDMKWVTEDSYSSPQQFDYDYEYEHSFGIDKSYDTLDWNKLVESQIIDDELVNMKDGWFDEFPQESFDQEESFNSDAFSNSDDDGGDDSTHSYDYPQILNNMVNSTYVEVPSQGLDKFSNENQTTQTEKNQENSIENFINSSPTDDQAKEPHSEVAHLKSDDSTLVLAITKHRKSIEDTDESEPFNPRAPNFLSLEPDPEAEKVDLRHQDVLERKNAEKWMVDYALREVVTKLGPAHNRKVALLVEAFEKVMPIKKCELHTSAFDQARMQACS